MSNAFFVAIVVYASLCVGTFINLSDARVSKLATLVIAIIVPVPVFVVLGWAAVSLARSPANEKKGFLNLLWLLALSFTMYSDAVELICKQGSECDNVKSVVTQKPKIQTYSFQVKKVIARHLMAA